SLHSLSASFQLPVSNDRLPQLAEKDWLEFTDARGAPRRLQLVARASPGYWAESAQTAYVSPGIKLFRVPGVGNGGEQEADYAGEVGALPQVPEKIRLYRGGTL